MRKDKKMSQDEVGKLVGIHGAVIGRYERDEVKPSIEMATQLAEALEVSLDYLVGSTDVLLEKTVVNRVLDIQKLKESEKQHVFALLDAFIKQTKLQSIL
ncbi:MAG: helix-turn-helix domain-containing protein [Mangrovibacterium sp.]